MKPLTTILLLIALNVSAQKNDHVYVGNLKGGRYFKNDYSLQQYMDSLYKSRGLPPNRDYEPKEKTIKVIPAIPKHTIVITTCLQSWIERNINDNNKNGYTLKSITETKSGLFIIIMEKY